MMKNYTVRDTTQGHDPCPIPYLADTAQEAAEAYVEGSDWTQEHTWWARLTVTAPDGEETGHTIAIDPEEPRCTEAEHEWDEGQAWGAASGGVVSTDICQHCNIRRVNASQASCPVTGQTMGPAVSYGEAYDA